MKILILALAFTLFNQNAPAKSFYILNSKIEQGDVLMIRITPQWQISGAAISIFNKQYLPNKNGEVFIGIDVGVKPGKYLAFLVEYGRGVRLDWFYEEIEVHKRQFSVYRFNKKRPSSFVSRAIRSRETKLINVAYTKSNSYSWYADGDFSMPLDNIVTSDITEEYGTTRLYNNGLSVHQGLDLRAKEGTSLYAINSGTVALAEKDFSLEGNFVIIDHGSDVFSIYLHMSKLSVTDGEKIKKKQIIGYTGKSGLGVTGPHLHFAIRVRGTNIDPIRFIEIFNQNMAP